MLHSLIAFLRIGAELQGQCYRHFYPALLHFADSERVAFGVVQTQTVSWHNGRTRRSKNP
jgi:hypothetical protein